MVWSRELAYAVGLITTDGNLSKDGRHINFTSTDRQLIKTFLKCLHKTNNIYFNPPSGLSKNVAYRAQIGDVNLYRWLQSIGLMPNKSKIISALNIPDEYFRDFLRGHLDGDGSVTYYIDRYNTRINPKYVYQRLLVRFLSASYLHIVWLRSRIFFLLGLRGSLNTRQIRQTRMTNLKFSTKQAKKVLAWIYYQPNLPCLLRKYQIAKDHVPLSF